MKTHVSALLLPLAALSLLPALAGAQTTTGRAPVHPSHPAVAIGNSGDFKSTDGTAGTFRETDTIYGADGSSTDTLLYTRSSDGATRVEQTTYQTNADGSHTRNFTLTDYGASSSSTSSETITTLGRGQSVGRGSYTMADGTSGTVTSAETTSDGGVDVLTMVYNSSTAGVSIEQRTTTNPASDAHFAAALGTVNGQISLLTGFTAIGPVGSLTPLGTGDGATFTITPDPIVHKTVLKTVTIDAAGQTTNTVQTRAISGDVVPLLP